MADRFTSQNAKMVILITGKPHAYQYVIASPKDSDCNAKWAREKLLEKLDIAGGGRPDRVQGLIKEGADPDHLCQTIKQSLA